MWLTGIFVYSSLDGFIVSDSIIQSENFELVDELGHGPVVHVVYEKYDGDVIVSQIHETIIHGIRKQGCWVMNPVVMA